jgi:hypothetical protein
LGRHKRDHSPRRGNVRERLGHNYLERLPLGTSFERAEIVRLVDRTIERIDTDASSGGSTPHLWLDAGGVGLPVADELQVPLRSRRLRMASVELTSGEEFKEDWWRPTIHYPKKALVSGVQTMLEWDRLRLPSNEMGGGLAEELQSFEVRSIGEGGRMVYGAVRTGSHDDLVVAVALGCSDRGVRSMRGAALSVCRREGGLPSPRVHPPRRSGPSEHGALPARSR